MVALQRTLGGETVLSNLEPLVIVGKLPDNVSSVWDAAPVTKLRLHCVPELVVGMLACVSWLLSKG